MTLRFFASVFPRVYLILGVTLSALGQPVRIRSRRSTCYRKCKSLGTKYAMLLRSSPQTGPTTYGHVWRRSSSLSTSAALSPARWNSGRKQHAATKPATTRQRKQHVKRTSRKRHGNSTRPSACERWKLARLTVVLSLFPRIRITHRGNNSGPSSRRKWQS